MYFLNYTPCVLLSWLHLTHPLWAHPSRPLTDKAVLEGDLIKDYIPQAHTDNIISLNADASPHENRPTNFVANIHQHVSTILADQVLHSANPEHVLNKDETSTRRIATKSDIEDHPFFSMMSSIFESRAVYLKMLTPAERTRADRLFAESKLPKNFNENLKQIDQIWTQILPDIAQIDTRWSTHHHQHHRSIKNRTINSMLSQSKKNRNKKGLALGEGASPTSLGGSKAEKLGQAPASSGRTDYHDKLTEQLATLEIGLEFKLDLHAEDLQILGDLGAGNGGTVCKAVHLPTKLQMARKLVHIDAKPSVRKQILRELQIMHDCRSPFIVSFYGAYLQDPHICMCMEYMDKSSLDNIYKKTGPIPEHVLGKITVAVVSGLNYLYDSHRIIHRDVKPSNVLFNSQGQVKICDFGVSGELINSIADTFVGTSTYMSPERIQGAQYTVKSDVWSLGITLIELALGRFPFAEETNDSDDSGAEEHTLSPTKPSGQNVQQSLDAAFQKREERDRERREKRRAKKEQEDGELGVQKKKKGASGVSLEGGSAQMSILELLQHVVNEPAPKLPADRFQKYTCDFLDACLLKEHDARPTPKTLTDFEWFKVATEDQVDLVQWASTLTL
ncbi:hypothetical protein PSTT_11999, partial [Puccinia striiformis]